ncbi:MAG: hypothetical protein FWC48_02505, partial [Actinomycetia bacterium]|nr:hypothetical protein [Actinomycetes bacterium]
TTPTQRPGEATVKIVLVANYDTERATLLSSESIASVGRRILWLAHGIIMALPLLALVVMVPLSFIKKLQGTLYPYNWYVLMALCLPVLVMLLDLLVAQILRRYSPGANNNASGVAALLSISEELAQAQGQSFSTSASMAATPAAASQTTTDFETTPLSTASAEPGAAAVPAPGSGAARYEDYDARSTFADERTLDAEQRSSRRASAPFTQTTDFGFGDDADPRAGAAPDDSSFEEDIRAGGGMLGADVIGGAAPDEFSRQFTDSFGAVSVAGDDNAESGAADDEFMAYAAGADIPRRSRSASKKKKGGLFGRRKKSDEFQAGDFDAADQPADWLGLGDDYNAREEGRKIGSWDNFPAGDDDDFDGGLSWKGGSAEGDLIEDADYAATQAARIRRKISEAPTSGISLSGKELWFVATSAHSVHSRGMRTFLEDHREELRGALFINLTSLGQGALYWSVNEQADKTYKSSARLTAMVRRVSREKDLQARPFKKGKVRTEAGWVLAAGLKAVSIMRLTEADAPFAAQSSQDSAGRLSVEKIDEVVDLVVSVLQEL